ncbi:hypothetical protein FXO38_26421 [Capsicum annuum]|nr:hypothetical protein FXO38_26421 [Capsicum annuum]KAF3662869.1 hypothetical protein FXO37_12267 [Capsicum annuum]
MKLLCGNESSSLNKATGKGKPISTETLPQGKTIGSLYPSAQNHASTSGLGLLNGPTHHKPNKEPTTARENSLGFLELDVTKNTNKVGPWPKQQSGKFHNTSPLGIGAKEAMTGLSKTFETTKSRMSFQTRDPANPHHTNSLPSDTSASINQNTNAEMTEMENKTFNSSTLSTSGKSPEYSPSNHLNLPKDIPSTSNDGTIHDPSPRPNLCHNPTPNDPPANFLARDRPNEPSSPPTYGMAGNQVQNIDPGSMLLSTSSDGRAEPGSHKFRPEHMAVHFDEANKPSPNSTTIPGNVECRDDPHGTILTTPPCENFSYIGEGPPFVLIHGAPSNQEDLFLSPHLLLTSTPLRKS